MSRGIPATQPRRPRTKRGGAFADLIYDARLEGGLTQAELAAAAALDRGTVIRWEAGTITRPELGGVRRACTVLDVNYVDALIALGNLSADHLAAAA